MPLLIAISLPVLLLGASVAASPSESARAVTRQEILDAMRHSQGYDLTATTNGARLQSEVLRRIAREAAERDPARRPLFFGHEEWFAAYLERTGLTAERAPLFMQLSSRHRQDIQVDYRAERVIERAPPEVRPDRALNVCIWWAEGEGVPDDYSYEDTLSQPNLKVTNERVITYRLLELPDMVVFDDIHGLLGRPTTGILAVLFKLIGEAHIKESRMALSSDGLQVSRGRGKKAMLEAVATVTVYPNGRTEKDLPAGRSDLVRIEERLKRPLDVRYRSMECPPGRP